MDSAVTQEPAPMAAYSGETVIEKPKGMDENVLWIEYDPMHEEFFSLIKQMCDTFLAKNSDYAGSDAVDMMKNFMACQEFGIKMSDGIATRMSDKIMRMQNLMRTRTQKVKDESLIDTVVDLANYCLLLTIALKREKQSEISVK